MFTAGQTVGGTQCAEVTILDNSVLEGERNFSIQLVAVSDGGSDDGDGDDDSGSGGAQIDPNVPSANIIIALDLDDGTLHICLSTTIE